MAKYLIIFNKNHVYLFKGSREKARQVAESLKQVLHFQDYEIKEVGEDGG